MVLDERYPSTKWSLRRIIKIHPGKNGHVRIITIRTQASTLRRPM